MFSEPAWRGQGHFGVETNAMQKKEAGKRLEKGEEENLERKSQGIDSQKVDLTYRRGGSGSRT